MWSVKYSQESKFTDRTKQDITVNASPSTYSGVQIFTFTPVGEVSNVHFTFINTKGNVVQMTVPENNYTGNISTACKVAVYFNEELNETAKGLTNSQSLTADVYVVFNDKRDQTGSEVTRKLSVDVSDCDGGCGGCGARTVNGGWLSFMCHNLGADQSLDPFTWNNSKGNLDGSDIKGDLYQWGRKTDGHQKRNSTTTGTLATSDTPNHPNLILVPSGEQNYPWDWRSGYHLSTRWGDGSQYEDENENQPKGYNDPCPPGWKVPSMKQWKSLYTNDTTPNRWKWTGSGFMVGSSLYLPAAGMRRASSGKLLMILNNLPIGDYWSSTEYSESVGILDFSRSSVHHSDISTRGGGLSVRCVAE